MNAAPIYLDYNATTPIDPLVLEAMLPFLREHFGNPSSSHPFGVAAKRAVERARAQVAALIGAQPEEIVFTSGGSESNNTVIRGVAEALGERGRHLITSAVEHPAVLEPCRALAAAGYRVSELAVDELGRVSPAALEEALSPETILITIMHANNEVGTIEPIEEIGAIARRRGVLLHSDAAQSVGKIPVRVDELGVDFLSIAGHKLYAPKGVGALYLRAGRELPSLVRGASHEAGRRAGTENVAAIVALGAACELAAERLEETMAHCHRMRDRLWEGLVTALGPLRRNGDPQRGLPNTLSVCFAGIDASALLAEIGHRVAASAGAACHAEGVDLSSVLAAMEVPIEEAMGTVRLSVGRATSAAEIDAAIAVVAEAVRRLRPGETGDLCAAGAGEKVRLTRFTHGMGCACKLRPQDLEQVLRALPATTDPAVLVDASSADDAAVYRLGEDLALVQTVDFFTPICDDPHDFGAISAANSLSDLYAMGAQPRFALSVVAFPTSRLPLEVLETILAGAAEVAAEAGIAILGGHSVEDAEPKFGLAVSGVVHPGRILSNAGARAGDRLILTKPLGTGIIATAAKRGLAAPEVERGALALMRQLNRKAAEAMLAFEVHACTDVTGFGLLGHLLEMSAGAGLDAVLEARSVPVLGGARELAAADIVPGGTLANLEHCAPRASFAAGLSRVDRILLADAQTSGGLLIAVAPQHELALLAALHERGIERARAIGHFTTAGAGRIRVE